VVLTDGLFWPISARSTDRNRPEAAGGKAYCERYPLGIAMEMHRKLGSAIEAFGRWDQPWLFYESVSATPSFDANDREGLQLVWGQQ
jgi:hypothetical protein